MALVAAGAAKSTMKLRGQWANEDDEDDELDDWQRRMGVVNEEIAEYKKEIQKKAQLAANETSKVTDMILAKHARVQLSEEVEYQEMMGQALKESGFKRVTAATHGWLHELLLTLPEAVKKSSHFARDITKTGQKEGELERVYEYQTRSSYTGSRMFLCEARAPGLFLRCRENLGFNSGAVSRGLRVDTDDGFFQCSNWYLTKTSDVCYKVIDEEEKEQILGMLDSYEEYTREEPYTLLPHFYAILTMSAPGKPRVNFLVTKNILHTLDIINEMIDIMGIVHPSSRTGARGGTVYVDPLNAKGVETDIYHIKPTKFVGDSQLNGKLQEVGAPVVMHAEEREVFIRQLRRDTLFLVDQGIYGYALVCGIHVATPWDPWDVIQMEAGKPSRFGGYDPCEDRYQIGLVGPFKRFGGSSRKGLASSLLAHISNSDYEPANYALRLREAIFNLCVEFGEASSYKVFRAERYKRFLHQRQMAEDDKEEEEEEMHYYTLKKPSNQSKVNDDKQKKQKHGVRLWNKGAAHGITAVGLERRTKDEVIDEFRGLHHDRSERRIMRSDTLKEFLDSIKVSNSKVLRKNDSVDPVRPGRAPDAGRHGDGDDAAGTPPLLGESEGRQEVIGKFVGEGGGAGSARAARMDKVESFAVYYNPMQEGVNPALQERRRMRVATKRRQTLGLGLGLGKRHDGTIVISRVDEGRSADRSNQVFVRDIVLGVATIGEGKRWRWVDAHDNSLHEVARGLQAGEENELVKLRLMTGEDDEPREVILRITPEEIAPAKPRGEEETAEVLRGIGFKHAWAIQYLIDNPPPRLTSPLEILAHPIDALDAEDKLLELDIFGAFVIYRDTKRVPPRPDCVWMTFCIAYMPEYGFVKHNTFHMVKIELLPLSHPTAAQWLAHNHWVTIAPEPWHYDAAGPMIRSNELYPSIIQMVLAQDILRAFVDLDCPPPRRVKYIPPPPVVVTKNVTLYDEWLEKHGGMERRGGERLLLTDMNTGAPMHPLQSRLQPEDVSKIDITAAELARMVAPAATLFHIKDYFPKEFNIAKNRLQATQQKNVEKMALLKAAEADAFGKISPGVQKRGSLWKLNSNATSPRDLEDWRERVFIISDGILSYLSENKGGKPKLTGDLRGCQSCKLFASPPFSNAVQFTFKEGVSQKLVPHTLAVEGDDLETLREWVGAFSLFSKRFHVVRNRLEQLHEEKEKGKRLAEANMLSGDEGRHY